MKAFLEREDFSGRLQQALRNAEYSPESPTQLARKFNMRFAGRPVTVHAARKWLVGEAIPTQEKLRTLADWLGVPADWLRFGGEQRSEEHRSDIVSPPRFESADVKLIAELQTLDEQYRVVAREIIRILVRINRQR